jgi:hypothetical protein
MIALACQNNIPTLDTRLKAIDWSFNNRLNGHGIDGIHPYPAKFISDIPRAFLSTLPIPKGTAILDPFCGSGTTLTEAQRNRLPSIGIDLNPIACLISRTKTSPTPPHFEATAIKIVEDARLKNNLESSTIPNINHWFKQEIQEALSALKLTINSFANKTEYDALRLALSSIIVRVSNQESDTRYAAIEKNISKSDVFNLFLSTCTKLNHALSTRDYNLSTVKVIEADVLSIDPSVIEFPIGMVITSPPYPNAYEYWLYHKYRMWWLDFDPLAVKKQEIGARAHFFKRNHHTDNNFWDQMRLTFRLIDAVLVKKGFACFVIGRSKIHGQIIDNGKIIEAIGEEYGLTLVSRLERIISPHRKSFNLSHANIKTESIIVFQKG